MLHFLEKMWLKQFLILPSFPSKYSVDMSHIFSTKTQINEGHKLDRVFQGLCQGTPLHKRNPKAADKMLLTINGSNNSPCGDSPTTQPAAPARRIWEIKSEFTLLCLSQQPHLEFQHSLKKMYVNTDSHCWFLWVVCCNFCENSFNSKLTQSENRPLGKNQKISLPRKEWPLKMWPPSLARVGGHGQGRTVCSRSR